VLGAIPRDQIVTHAGERFHKYGCVIYTAAALSSLLDPGDVVVPISHVREEDEGPIKQILGTGVTFAAAGPGGTAITAPGSEEPEESRFWTWPRAGAIIVGLATIAGAVAAILALHPS
jgi:hypothetical protein